MSVSLFLITRECICILFVQFKKLRIALFANISESFVLLIVPGVFTGLVSLNPHNHLTVLLFQKRKLTPEELTCLKLHSIEVSGLGFESGTLAPHAILLIAIQCRVSRAKREMYPVYSRKITKQS